MIVRIQVSRDISHPILFHRKRTIGGTCLCMTCLNPQIKVERINQLKRTHSVLSGLSSLIGNDLISVASDDKQIRDILKELNLLKTESFMVTYVEWVQIKSHRGSGLISTKKTMTNEFSLFCLKLIDEITVSKSKEKKNEVERIIFHWVFNI